MTQQKERFDFIILDLSMPIMDGYEACKQIIEYYGEEHKLIGHKSLQSKTRRFELFLQNHKDQNLDQNEIVQKSQKLLEVFEEVGQQPILVALSALITDEVREKCLGVGFTEILESPLSANRVEEIIK